MSPHILIDQDLDELNHRGCPEGYKVLVMRAQGLSVTGILMHRSGHRESTTMLLPFDTSGSKNAVQAVGSSTSYGKRYVMSALLNLATRGEDDDGHAAVPTANVTSVQASGITALLSRCTEKTQEVVRRRVRVCRVRAKGASRHPGSSAQQSNQSGGSCSGGGMKIITEIEQGTPEWLALRLGIITCSELECLLVNGKGDSGFGAGEFTYMKTLIGERITEEAANPFTGNKHTERGHELEGIARGLYESQVEVILSGEIPKEHLAQYQGGLWVSEREWIDFVCYWPGMSLFIKRAYRDEVMIRKLIERVKRSTRFSTTAWTKYWGSQHDQYRTQHD